MGGLSDFNKRWRYGRAAREKKIRLAQGRGIKGLYKEDMASFWDSLPTSPDPKSVAQDIHQYLPTLVVRWRLSGPFRGVF